MLNFTDYKHTQNDQVVSAVLYDGTPEMAREILDWLDTAKCVVDVDYINGELVTNPNEKYESVINKDYYLYVTEGKGLAIYPVELFEAHFAKA